MPFYHSIAEHYHHIFPYNAAQFTFISQNLQAMANHRIVEVGSATGILTSACKQNNYTIEGLELDQQMVQIARRHHPDIPFIEANMLDIDAYYDEQSLAGIICFGNTLVHLKDQEEIRSFLAKAYKRLQPKGKLLLQFINYDRILNQQIDHLPTISNDVITFERNYKHLSNDSVDFDTRLRLHQSGEELTNTQRLYPLRKSDFEQLAQHSGFSTKAFGGFDAQAWTAESMQSVFICEK